MMVAAFAVSVDRLRAEFDAAFAEPAKQTHDGLRDFVLVATGSMRWALPLEGLRAIEHDRVLTPMPSSRPSLLGFAGVRSLVVPVFDLGALLGTPHEAATPAWRRAPVFALLDVTPTEQAGVAFERLLQFARVDMESVSKPAGGSVRVTLHHEEEAYTVVEAAELLEIIRVGETFIQQHAQPVIRTTEHAQDGDTTR